MSSLTSFVSLWVMLSTGPGNGWTENKALADCPFSMRVLFYWFNLHLVCGVPGYGESCSLFWVMRAEEEEPSKGTVVPTTRICDCLGELQVTVKVNQVQTIKYHVEGSELYLRALRGEFVSLGSTLAFVGGEGTEGLM